MNFKKVRSEAELRLYLTKKAFTHIAIDSDIVLSSPVVINRSVKLFCTEQGLVRANYPGTIEDHSLFVCKAPSVDFELMRIFNISETGVTSAVKYDYNDGEGVISSSLFKGFSWGAIWQFNIKKLHVLNCDIVGNNGDSYNYGIWQGGKTDIPPMQLFVTACTFKEVRHALGASYHKNSYHAIGNEVSTLKHSFDRHNWNGGTVRKGGFHTTIANNIFLDTDRLAFSLEPPYEGGSFVFSGNTLNHSKTRHVGEISDIRVYENPLNGLISNQFTDS